jgi:hypothetical protein
MNAIEADALKIIAGRLKAIDLSDIAPELKVSVFERSLDRKDPDFSVGVELTHWEPTEYNIGLDEPAISKSHLAVDTFVKHADREVGRRLSLALTNKVRHMLYRDESLRVSLGALMEGDSPPFRRVLKFGVNRTDYASGEIMGGFGFLSQTDTYLDIETA